MCGRATLVATTDDIADVFGVAPTLPAGPPRFNLAPGQDLVALHAKEGGGMELVTYRWGLVPWWSKDKKIANRTINARYETVTTSPAFRDAWKARRCLVVIDGFYEWEKSGAPKAKRPHHIRYDDRRPFTLAGIWDRWTNKESGEVLESCSIVTTEAHGGIVALHDRMPLVLDGSDRDRWLGSADDARAVLAHAKETQEARAHELVIVPVSTRVNDVRNDDPECLAPPDADPLPKQTSLFE
ncbi:MAG: SOS response-associated peptidase [Deltaproteobacteria bacterium]|nr:SOS response-associated peptidase [Deltaproteobacteria bacterium]